jgi:hypothetical protein
VTLSGVVWGAGAAFYIGTANTGGQVDVAPGLREAPVTFTAWLAPQDRADEGSNTHGITPFPPAAVSGDAAGQFGFGIGLDVWSDNGGGSALAVENVGYDFANTGNGAFYGGVEYFVAAAIGSTAYVYVNGAVVAGIAPTTPGAATVTTLGLGVHNDDTGYGTKRFYYGRMRDVRVYKRQLTGAEVSALYTAGPAL